MSSYGNKLRDPRWQKKRLEVLERDGWRCVMCHRNDLNLQVHHVVYRRLDPWEYPLFCYQTLCEKCHQERQEITDRAVDALRLSLKDLPTLRMALVAQKLCTDALRDMEVESA